MDPHCHLHLHLHLISLSCSIPTSPPPPPPPPAVLPDLHPEIEIHGLSAGMPRSRSHPRWLWLRKRVEGGRAVDPSWEAAQGDAAACRRAARTRRYGPTRHHDFRGSTFRSRIPHRFAWSSGATYCGLLLRLRPPSSSTPSNSFTTHVRLRSLYFSPQLI